MPAGAPGNYPPSGGTAGWYADPHGNGGLRWWDGVRWTDEVADAPSAGSVRLVPPGAERLGDRPDGRPAPRGSFRRLFLIRMGIGVLVVTGTATVIWAVEHNTGGTDSPRVSASITTIAPAAPPPRTANSSSRTTVITNLGDQTITLEPARGLHDDEVIHIVAKGYTPGLQYSSMECKADSYAEGDCNTANS